MEQINALIDWLANNESALSAAAAILVISGLLYGIAQFFIKSVRFGRSNNSASKPLPASTEQSESSPKSEPKPSHHLDFSLVIVAFETLSDNKDDEFLSHGITSEIVALVTTVKNIRVSSRLVPLNADAESADLKNIAEQYHSNFALTGTLMRVGERIQIAAQLIDIKNDRVRWARNYDQPLNDLFAVQHEIAECIVGSILGEVKAIEASYAQSIPEHQLDAWGLVQKAYRIWLTTFSREGIMEARHCLRKAIELSPEYPKARAVLAMVLAQQMTSRICDDYDSCAKEAKALIEVAYQQAPNDMEILANAGVVWQNLGDSDRAETALRRVLEMAPLYLIAKGYLAMLLSLTGDDDSAREARELMRDNFSIAPNHPATAYWVFFNALAEQRLGNHQRVIELTQKSVMAQPGWTQNYFTMANSYCLLGKIDEAQAAIAQGEKTNPALTAQYYAENIVRICRQKSNHLPFVKGLSNAGLITL